MHYLFKRLYLKCEIVLFVSVDNLQTLLVECNIIVDIICEQAGLLLWAKSLSLNMTYVYEYHQCDLLFLNSVLIFTK